MNWLPRRAASQDGESCPRGAGVSNDARDTRYPTRWAAARPCAVHSSIGPNLRRSAESFFVLLILVVGPTMSRRSSTVPFHTLRLTGCFRTSFAIAPCGRLWLAPQSRAPENARTTVGRAPDIPPARPTDC